LLLYPEGMETMSGPYQTERDTYSEPMLREVSDLHSGDWVRSGLVQETVLRHLVEACDAAGVAVGKYDLRVLDWLARGETSTAQVVLDLIARAHAAQTDQSKSDQPQQQRRRST
jgi:hypothetical protein